MEIFLKKSVNIIFMLFLGFILILNLKMPVLYIKNTLWAVPAAVIAGFIYFGGKKISFAKGIASAFAVILAVAAILRAAALRFITIAPADDYKTLIDAAMAASRGDLWGFAADSYIARFPHLTGYTAVLSLIFRLLGENLFFVKIFNLIFSLLSVYAIALAGKEVAGSRGGIFAALFFALSPAHILYTTTFATENFAMPFFIFSVYFLLKSRNQASLKPCLISVCLSGIFLGVGSFFRGVGIFYMTAYLIYVILILKKRKKLFCCLVLFLAYLITAKSAAYGLYLGGITEYVGGEYSEPVITSVLIGFNFDTGGMFSQDDRNIFLQTGRSRRLTAQIAKEKLLRRLSAHKGELISLFIKKSSVLWENGAFGSVYLSAEGSRHASLLYILCYIYHIILLTLALAGSIKGLKNYDTLLFSLTLPVFHFGLMLIEVQPRYTFAAGFMFILCAVSAINNKKTLTSNLGCGNI